MTKVICWSWLIKYSLQWHHNECNCISNYLCLDCLLNRLFRNRSKKTSKLKSHWPLCGEFTRTGEIPAQMPSNVENVSIWWRHPDPTDNATATSVGLCNSLSEFWVPVWGEIRYQPCVCRLSARKWEGGHYLMMPLAGNMGDYGITGNGIMGLVMMGKIILGIWHYVPEEIISVA